MNYFDTPAPWAYSWCYFFATMGTLVLISGIISVVVNSRSMGFLLTLFVVLITLMEAATFFTLFWMCRGSLRH